jgi:hypothetical protein
MPVAGGPNTLGENNLVFAYDTGDVKNSYIGEPTVNIYSTDGFSFWQLDGNHTATRYTGNAPELITITSNYDYHTIVTTGNWSSEANRALVWTNSGLLQLSTQYAVSFYARVTSTSAANIGAAFYGNALPNTLALTNQWQRFTVLTSTTATYIPFEFGSKSGAITFQVAGIQYEAKTHSTPYVNGTRSATQGLLPVIGNSTIDLTNMSFDSSAKMTFDGTNDYVSCGTLLLNFSQGITVEAIANFTNVGAWQRIMDFGNGSASNNILFSRYGSTDNLFFEIYNGASSTSINTSGGIVQNQLCHYVVTVNGAMAYVYRNGVLINSGTFATVPTTVSRTNCYIGKSNWADEYFQGQIPITKIYNRALTTQEVRQNYQQYKTRFNLS